MIPQALHRTQGNPYYIYAPDYRDTSSGVCVMHFLCHALNISGQEAYVVGCTVVNPNLRTPALTDVVRHVHKVRGVSPIAVYPEVISGNPLGSPVVVRYMLNRDGFLNGLEVGGQKSDLYYYYAHDFADGKLLHDMLTLPTIDSTLFAPPVQPIARRGHYLYLHRFDAQQVDYSLLPADVQVLSLSNPRTLPELAVLFQSAQTLYTYEISATCTMALMCGCPVIYLRGGHVHELPFTEHIGDAGAAMLDEPGGIERARHSVGLARQRLLRMEDEFWPQLKAFIGHTQRVAAEHSATSQTPSVRDWLLHRQLTPVQRALVDVQRNALTGQTRLSVVVSDNSGEYRALSDTLESLALWSTSSPLQLRVYVVSRQPLPSLLASNVQWIDGEPEVGLLNQIAEHDDGQWLLLMESGEELLPSGCVMLDLELPGAQGCRMLYADEIYRTQGGASPVLRPDMNLDYLLSIPAIMARHWIIRRELLLQVGGFDRQLPNALELGVILRLIEAHGLDGIGHLDEPLVICDAADMSANPDEVAQIRRHLVARDYPQAQVLETPPRHYHIDYSHSGQPTVSILIAVRDQLDLVRRCVDSLLSKTRYSAFELILLDSASQSPALQEWLEQLVVAGQGLIKVIRDEAALNFSALYNLGARHAQGDFLLLLNNDCVAFDEQWLEHLLNHAMRPEVGVVAPKLLDIEGKLAHAGYVLGLNGSAASPGVGLENSEAGYLQYLLVDRDVSAVSGACLMIRRELFESLGGMDESAFALRFNDLDLCLRASAQGLLNVWNARALVACERVDGWTGELRKPDLRVRLRQDEDNLHARWHDSLIRDPAYNKNLSLRGAGHELPALHALTWRPLSWRPLPVVLVHPDSERPQRCIDTFEQLLEHGQVDGCSIPVLLSGPELGRLNPDVVVFAHVADSARIATVGTDYARHSAFKVLEVEELPQDERAWQLLHDALAVVDRVVVATERLAHDLAHMHADVRVRATRLMPPWQKPLIARPSPEKLRIGCPVQLETLAMVEPILRACAGRAHWVLWGDVPAHLAPLVEEVHPQDITSQPELLHSLALDLALIPMPPGVSPPPELALRLAASGVAIISNDDQAQVRDWPMTFVVNRSEHWIEAVDAYLQAPQNARAAGLRLRQVVEGTGFFDAVHREVCLRSWMQS